jgi:hypothetical protein
MMSNNQLRTENEALIDTAESEIKRMSDFVDKYTSDSEKAQKNIIADYESKLQAERVKVEDIKQKSMIEKGDIEAKYNKIQKELETLK